MGLAKSIEAALLPEDLTEDRQSRLFMYLCLAATFSALAAGCMTWLYGYAGYAKVILICAVTLPVALLILRFSRNSTLAAHYLLANLLLQSMLLTPDPEVGVVTVIAMAAGAALFQGISAYLWISVLLTYCVWVAATANTLNGSATAASSALISLVVFFIVQASEKSRARSTHKINVQAHRLTQQTEIMRRMAEQYFDCSMQITGNDVFAVSPGVRTLLGYTQDEFMDQPLRYFLHPDNADLPERLRPEFVPLREEVRVRHADGHWLWVELYATPDFFNLNTNRCWLAMRDFERQRKVSDQLLQAQRLESMGNMAAAMAHDFNNMLTVIMGIAADLPSGSARSEIMRVAHSATTMTGKLMAFGQGQHGAGEIHDLTDLMRGHSHYLQHGLDSRYIVIETYTDEPMLVRIEDHLLEQVLVNLINNARDAMPAGGELEVSLQSVELPEDHPQGYQREYAMLEVRDSGTGMDETVRKRALEPFFTTKSSNTHSGLGLSSCYGIIARQGGFIDIESRPGAGTAVRVYLPIAETRDHEPMLELLESETCIMVVDDDPGIVRVLRSALTKAGLNVKAFTDAKAAVEYFTPGKVTMLVTDVVMPDISGFTLAHKLRQQSPQLPLLFLSGFGEEELRQWQPDEHSAFLAKPFHPEEIVSRIKALSASAPAPGSNIYRADFSKPR